MAPATGDAQVFVARYRANGRLDPAFVDGGLFQAVAYSPDGRYVPTVGLDGTPRVYDAPVSPNCGRSSYRR